MDRRSRVAIWSWAALVLAISAGIVIGALGDQSWPWLTNDVSARITVAAASSATLMMVLIQIGVHYLYPPDIRHLRILSCFLMSITGGFSVGSWVLIPVSRIGIVSQWINIEVSVGDAVLITVITVPVGIAGLIIVAKLFVESAKRWEISPP